MTDVTKNGNSILYAQQVQGAKTKSAAAGKAKLMEG